MRPGMKRSISISAASMCVGAGLTALVMGYTIEKLERQVQAVEYLKNYNCYTVTCKTTQYTLDPAECSKDKTHKYFGITKSGKKAVQDWTVATDWSKIPKGAIVIDPETGKKYMAEDTGNEVRGWHVDFFRGQGTPENVKIARGYGVRYKQLIVIE